MYVFLCTEPGVLTVGFFDPRGVWIPESDHANRHAAAERVAYLNGRCRWLRRARRKHAGGGRRRVAGGRYH